MSYLDYKIDKQYVEIYCKALWDLMILLNAKDDHCKTYDPMEIDDTNKIAHSYVFDLWDGGRHHHYDSLEQIMSSALAETVVTIRAKGDVD